MLCKGGFTAKTIGKHRVEEGEGLNGFMITGFAFGMPRIFCNLANDTPHYFALNIRNPQVFFFDAELGRQT